MIKTTSILKFSCKMAVEHNDNAIFTGVKQVSEPFKDKENCTSGMQSNKEKSAETLSTFSDQRNKRKTRFPLKRFKSNKMRWGSRKDGERLQDPSEPTTPSSVSLSSEAYNIFCQWLRNEEH